MEDTFERLRVALSGIFGPIPHNKLLEVLDAFTPWVRAIANERTPGDPLDAIEQAAKKPGVGLYLSHELLQRVAAEREDLYTIREILGVHRSESARLVAMRAMDLIRKIEQCGLEPEASLAHDFLAQNKHRGSR